MGLAILDDYEAFRELDYLGLRGLNTNFLLLFTSKMLHEK